MLETKMATN